MKIKSIDFPTYEEDITQPEYSCLDVFIKLEDGFVFTVEFTTVEYIKYFMERENTNYFGLTCPRIIVKKLTREIIEETVKFYVEEWDGYWLNLYHFSADIPRTLFDQLKEDEFNKVKEDRLIED